MDFVMELQKKNQFALSIGGLPIKARYQIAESLNGVVYVAEDTYGTQYNVKSIRVPRAKNGAILNEEIAYRAETEVALVRELKPHPNIVKVFDSCTTWTDNEVWYHIIREMCPGSVLSMNERSGGKLLEKDIMWILRDVLMALLYLHTQNPPIAHRSLTVANLLIGSDGRCKISDFEACKLDHHPYAEKYEIALAKEEIRRHSPPAYRAPEQVDFSCGYVISEQVDIWAVGIIIFYLAFGFNPFETMENYQQEFFKMRQKIIDHIHGTHPYSSGMCTIIEKCMELDPALRPTCGKLIRLCESLFDAGKLPWWLSIFGKLPETSVSPLKSPVNDYSKTCKHHSLKQSSQNREIDSTTACNESYHDSYGRNSTAGYAGTFHLLDNKIGDALKSKYYKLMGSDQQKSLWVLKVTSRITCAPKPKYIRKIVLAIWDGEFSITTFMEHLRFRPIEENPVVALKSLMTIMKIFQFGPPQCVSDFGSYIDVIEGIGEFWLGYVSISTTANKYDPIFMKLIHRFAACIVEKVKLYQYYHQDFSALNSNMALISKMQGLDTEYIIAAVKRLILLQSRLLSTQQQAFMITEGGNTGVQQIVRSLLLPLVDESIMIYDASKCLLVSLQQNPPPSTTISNLIAEFDAQLVALQDFISSANKFNEVYLVRLTPIINRTSNHSALPSPVNIPEKMDIANNNLRPVAFSQMLSKESAFHTLKHDECIFLSINNKLETTWNDDDSDIDEREVGSDSCNDDKKSNNIRGRRSTIPVNSTLEYSKPVDYAPTRATSDQQLHVKYPVLTQKSSQISASPRNVANLLGDCYAEKCSNHSSLEMPNVPKLSGGDVEFVSPPRCPQPPPFLTHLHTESTLFDFVQPESLNKKLLELESKASLDHSKCLPVSYGQSDVTNTENKEIRSRQRNSRKNLSKPQERKKKSEQSLPQQDLIDTSAEETKVLSTEAHLGKAVSDFSASSPEQLSFQKGDFISVKTSSAVTCGWVLGELNGKTGWVPKNLMVSCKRPNAGNINSSAEICAVQTINIAQPVNMNYPPIESISGISHSLKEIRLNNEKAIADPLKSQVVDQAMSQPWKDSLTPVGKQTLVDLSSFMQVSGLILNFDEIKLQGVIGSGAFAMVFRAVYRNKIVAVKKLMGTGGSPMEKILRDFKSEASLLSRLCHPNIISLIGGTVNPLTIVMEFCTRGNLMQLLLNMSITLSWSQRLHMCLDIAKGMQYLHNQNPVIIHRDLKSLNILVDESWVCKVTDFGLSRFTAISTSEVMTGQAGTYHWMSPEVINSQHYTEKADVYSFAIILWEILMRRAPYEGMQPVQVIAAVLGRKERPRIPPACPGPFSHLMQNCWQHDPSLRPSFNEIVSSIGRIPSS